jgi:hypothetical protein
MVRAAAATAIGEVGNGEGPYMLEPLLQDLGALVLASWLSARCELRDALPMSLTATTPVAILAELRCVTRRRSPSCGERVGHGALCGNLAWIGQALCCTVEQSLPACRDFP